MGLLDVGWKRLFSNWQASKVGLSSFASRCHHKVLKTSYHFWRLWRFWYWSYHCTGNLHCNDLRNLRCCSWRRSSSSTPLASPPSASLPSFRVPLALPPLWAVQALQELWALRALWELWELPWSATFGRKTPRLSALPTFHHSQRRRQVVVHNVKHRHGPCRAKSQTSLKSADKETQASQASAGLRHDRRCSGANGHPSHQVVARRQIAPDSCLSSGLQNVCLLGLLRFSSKAFGNSAFKKPNAKTKLQTQLSAAPLVSWNPRLGSMAQARRAKSLGQRKPRPLKSKTRNKCIGAT